MAVGKSSDSFFSKPWPTTMTVFYSPIWWKGKILPTLHFLRQQRQKAAGKPNYCLSDFVAPETAGKEVYLRAFAVTAASALKTSGNSLRKSHDDYSSILLKALADRLAEAFAERMHARVLGICGDHDSLKGEFWGTISGFARAHRKKQPVAIAWAWKNIGFPCILQP